METKKYWQAVDKDKSVGIFTSRPVRNEDDGGNYEIDEKTHGYRNIIYTFPIPLKPLQIAEITVNENGTWSWEIEREEGWYAAEYADKKELINRGKTIFIEYKGGAWFYPSRSTVGSFDMAQLTISSIRIPDECII